MSDFHLVAWVVVQREDGRVLLGRRADVSYASGLWGLPGGHVEDGEPLTTAAAREVHEEVGLHVGESDLEPLGVSRWEEDGKRGCDFVFRTGRWQGDASAVSECSAVDWFDPANLPQDALPWLAEVLGSLTRQDVWLHELLGG